MKFFALPFILIGVAAFGKAESPPFTPLRWSEDYSYLATKQDKDIYEHFKYSPLGRGAYLSLGGSIRQRVNSYHNDRFGLAPTEDDGTILLHRLLVHGDLHVNEQLRGFVEIGNYLNASDNFAPGPFDENTSDLAQAFFDLEMNDHRIRMGRQYSPLGSSRLVSLRDGPNVRLHFDGVRTDSKLEDGHVTLLALSETTINEDEFDDTIDDDSNLWGAYTTWDLGTIKADLYYLGVYKEEALYNQTTESETRHSVGTRLFANHGGWDCNHELVYQFGRFGSGEIGAWTVATIIGHTFKQHYWSPRMAVSVNIASGDDDPADSNHNTFSPLFPRLPYFEEAAILVPQNFFNVDPSLTLNPTEHVEIALSWNFFWRVEENDAVYSRGLRPLPKTGQQSGYFVTHVPSLNVDYELSRHIVLELSYSHFFVGEVIEDVGGHDVDFAMGSVTWSF